MSTETNLMNPKAAVFDLAVLPGFLAPVARVSDTLTLSAVFLAVAIMVHGGIGAAVGTGLVERSERGGADAAVLVIWKT